MVPQKRVKYWNEKGGIANTSHKYNFAIQSFKFFVSS